MRCSANLLVPAMVLAASVAALAQSPTPTPQYNVGKPLSQEEIQRFDFMIGPQGQQLPAGSGTAKEKIEALRAAGIEIAASPADLGVAVQRCLAGRARRA